MNNLYFQIESIFQKVLRRWEKVGFSEVEFPEICYEALELPTDYNVAEILEFTNLSQLPVQSYPNDEFGEIPFTVFRHEKFFVDIYMWNVHNTSIHDHNFTGAFKILHGHSKKMNFDFEPVAAITEDFLQGELKPQGMRDLNVGDREIILPFEKYIHKITHLTNPTVTLLIRTNGMERGLNLYNKKFKFQYRRSRPAFVSKFNCIRFIYSSGAKETKNQLKLLISQLDNTGLVQLLLSYISISPNQTSSENVSRMWEDFKALSEEGIIPEWFCEFLTIEIENREKELRFQKMKLFGII